MDHTLATDSMAVERYLLGELHPDERREFEEHAFACDECAGAIDNGIAFLDNGRELVAGRQRFDWRRIVTWVPTSVAAALAVVVSLLISRPPPQPTSVPAIQVVSMFDTDQARGTADKHPPAGKPWLLLVNIPSEQTYPSYRCELRDVSGHVRASLTVTEEQSRQIVPMLLSPLPAGSYVLSIEGVREDGNRTPIVSNPVNVQGP
jgi:Putative zinc-finger